MKLLISILIAIVPLAATASIVFLSITENGVVMVRPDRASVIAFLFVLAGAVFQITKEIIDWRQETHEAVAAEIEKRENAKRTATTGILKADKPFPNIRYSYSVDSPPTLRLGKSETYLTISVDNWMGEEGPGDLSKPRAIFSGEDGDENYAIYLWFKEGKPQIKMNLFNARNQLVAKVDGDRWSVKREYLWDVNYDDQAFEVRNERDEVQLQLVFYKNLIELSYFNYSPIGAVGIFTVDGKAVQSSWRHAGPPEFRIEPIFKYPSIEFQGVRASM